RLQDGMGDVHPPPVRGCAVQMDARGRRQRRAARRGRVAQLEGAALDRHSGVGGVMPMSDLLLRPHPEERAIEWRNAYSLLRARVSKDTGGPHASRRIAARLCLWR